MTEQPRQQSVNDPIVEDVNFTGEDARAVASRVRPIEVAAPDGPADLPTFSGAVDKTAAEMLIEEQSELAGGTGPDGRYFEVVLPATIHYKCIGRLINQGGQSSAALIGPNLILTAGHCVVKGGTNSPVFANQFFQPGYPRGRAYRVVRIAVHRGWVREGAWQTDIAVGLLEEVASPDLWFGVKCNIGVDTGHATYGYPGQGAFDGTKCFGDSGPPTNKPWKAPNDWTPSPLRFNLDAIANIDLTPGCSGGPWVGDSMRQGTITHQSQPRGGPGSGLFITGINSFTFNKYPGIMISPYFGADIDDFVRKAVKQLSG